MLSAPRLVGVSGQLCFDVSVEEELGWLLPSGGMFPYDTSNLLSTCCGCFLSAMAVLMSFLRLAFHLLTIPFAIGWYEVVCWILIPFSLAHFLPRIRLRTVHPDLVWLAVVAYDPVELAPYGLK